MAKQTTTNEHNVHHRGNVDKAVVPCVAIIGAHSSVQKYNTKKQRDRLRIITNNMIDQEAQDEFYKNHWQSNIHLFKHSGENLVDEINQLNPSLVIDAGCGINFLKGKIKNLIGYDPVFKEADIKCGHFDAPFKTECADVILALGSVNWGNHDDIANMLIKLKSWLKPGGFWR